MPSEQLNRKSWLDRPYYRWVIATNFPKSGEITFGATGFTQFPREEPVVCKQQQLPASDRADFSLTQVSQVLAKNKALPGFKWAKEPDRVSHSGSRWR